MAQNTLYDFSTTAGSNTDVAGISVAEGWLPSTVNNYERAWMAIVRKDLNDKGGTATVAGTANAITVTSASPASYGSLVNGLRMLWKPASSNSTAATKNLDALGAKAIRKIVGGTDVALVSGDLLAGVRAETVYDSTANAAAGAWILLNPAGVYTLGNQQTLLLPWTDNTATAGPTFQAGRARVTPAAGDLLGTFESAGYSSTLVLRTYALLSGRAESVTNGIEFGSAALTVINSGSNRDMLYVARDASGSGLATNAVGLPRGQLSFPVTQNASSDANTLDDYEEGTFTPTVSFGGASVGVTYTTQSGNYTKIGNQVTISFRIVLSAKGSSTGSALFNALPFTVGGDTAMAAIGGSAGVFAAMTAGFTGRANGGSTNITLRLPSTTGWSSAADTNFTATSDATVSGSYLL